MTDNRTTELLPAERGTLTADDIRDLIERHSDESGGNGRDFHNGAYVAIADELNARAELGSEPPYDELLRCLENDWHIHASWDGLRKFWCIELTEEGVKLRDATHGTLTAEQVRETVEKHWHDLSADYDMPEATALPEYSYDWQAIADELNARAERTCEIESSYLNDFTVKNMCWYEFEMKCGYRFTWDVMEPPRFCPNCGGEVKVVDA